MSFKTAFLALGVIIHFVCAQNNQYSSDVTVVGPVDYGKYVEFSVNCPTANCKVVHIKTSKQPGNMLIEASYKLRNGDPKTFCSARRTGNTETTCNNWHGGGTIEIPAKTFTVHMLPFSQAFKNVTATVTLVGYKPQISAVKIKDAGFKKMDITIVGPVNYGKYAEFSVDCQTGNCTVVHIKTSKQPGSMLIEAKYKLGNGNLKMFCWDGNTRNTETTCNNWKEQGPIEIPAKKFTVFMEPVFPGFKNVKATVTLVGYTPLISAVKIKDAGYD